jgi:hypothetical protein
MKLTGTPPQKRVNLLTSTRGIMLLGETDEFPGNLPQGFIRNSLFRRGRQGDFLLRSPVEPAERSMQDLTFFPLYRACPKFS